MPHTSMLARVRRAFKEALGHLDDDRSPATPGLSRRDFLRQTACMAGAVLLGSAAGHARTAPNVVVLGAGMAGLNAARCLVRGGLVPRVYEAGTRSGGRMFTAHDRFGPGTWTELGGEFIDSDHKAMLGLVREFNLELLDLRAPSETKLQETWFFNGRIITDDDVVKAFQPIAKRLQKDIDRLPREVTYRTTDPAIIALDRQPLSDYLRAIGASGLILQVLSDVYVIEYGLELGEQSALNLISLISTRTDDHKLHTVGASDERYKIRGGNQQLVDRMAAALAKSTPVHLGHRLVAMRDRSGGGYTLSFEASGRSVDVSADFVICAIPFSVLRTIPLPASLSARKLNAIKNLGYGTNSKLIAGFKRRFWRAAGRNGIVYTDQPFQFSWDSTQEQPGTQGSLTFYLGGRRGIAVGEGEAKQQAAAILPQIAPVFRGTTAESTGVTERIVWARQPLVRGSYSAYRVGQWTSIGGTEATPEGQMYFAGEHCSREFQGFMNGAADSGQAAATALLRRLGAKIVPLH